MYKSDFQNTARHLWFYPIAVLLLLMLVQTSGMVANAQSAKGSICVKLMRPEYNDVLFNFTTDHAANIRQPSVPPPRGWFSPNSRYHAFDYPLPASGGSPVPGAALYVEEAQSGKVVQLHPVIDSSGFSTLVAWSPDSQRIASLWIAYYPDGSPGEYFNLSVSHPDGTNAYHEMGYGNTTNPLREVDAVYGGNLRWSADSKYLALSSGEGHDYIWSLLDAGFVGAISLDVPSSSIAAENNVSAWSSSGHQLASISTKGSTSYLTINPLEPAQTIVVPIDPIDDTSRVSWSPNDEYLILSSQPDSMLFKPEIISVFRHDGSLVTKLPSPQPGERNWVVNWSSNNQELIYAHEHQDGNTDLMMLDLANGNGHAEFIERNLSAFYADMGTNKSVIALKVGFVYQVYLSDLSGYRLKTLTVSAGQIVDVWWSPDHAKVGVIWIETTPSATSPITHLTVINTDGSDMHDVSGDFTFVPENDGYGTHLQRTWLDNNRWLIFPSLSEKMLWLDTINLQTGEYHHLAEFAAVDNVSNARNYSGYFINSVPSPDNTLYAVAAQDGLYVATLDGLRTGRVSTHAPNWWITPTWSPDSKLLAFSHGLATSQSLKDFKFAYPSTPAQQKGPVEDIIEVVSIDGITMGEAPVYGLLLGNGSADYNVLTFIDCSL